MPRKKLICKDCYTEIFVDVNMVMLKDKIWFVISDYISDAICDKCIEKRMGRKITQNDFKTHNGKSIPCNEMWLQNKST